MVMVTLASLYPTAQGQLPPDFPQSPISPLKIVTVILSQVPARPKRYSVWTRGRQDTVSVAPSHSLCEDSAMGPQLPFSVLDLKGQMAWWELAPQDSVMLQASNAAGSRS